MIMIEHHVARMPVAPIHVACAPANFRMGGKSHERKAHDPRRVQSFACLRRLGGVPVMAARV